MTLAGHLVQQAAQHQAEGITLLGGEPFEQAAALASVAVKIRSAGLTVMTFTGYLLDDLQAWSLSGMTSRHSSQRPTSSSTGRSSLLRSIAIDQWVGSTNQGFHSLTDRYRALVNELDRNIDRLEIRVDSDGTVSVNGWADDDTLDALLHDLGRRKR